MQYQKKHTVVDAVQVPLPKEYPEWVAQAHASGHLWALQDGSVRVKTNHGTAMAKLGDWIIRNASGEVYPCNAAIFDASYEPAKEPQA
jgi:hypothetical protein